MSGASLEGGCDSTWPVHIKADQASWKPGRDSHQPADMTPLRSWNFTLVCRVSLPCNDIASQRKWFACLAQFQMLHLYSRYPRVWLTVPRWSCSPVAGLRAQELWPHRSFGKGSYFLWFKVGVQTPHSQWLDKVNIVIPVRDLELLGSEAQPREKWATENYKVRSCFSNNIHLVQEKWKKKQANKNKKTSKEANKQHNQERKKEKERRKKNEGKMEKKKKLCTVRSNKTIKYVINPHGKRI